MKMVRDNRWRYGFALAALLAMFAFVLSACGGGGDSTTAASTEAGSSTEAGGSTEASGSSEVEEAAAVVAEFTGPPTEWTGPTSSPKPEPGKKIAIISCAQASNCAVNSNGTKEAAEAAGWTADVIDGKGDTALWNSAIKQAVNAGYDGIVDVAITPVLAKEGLRYAQKKGVPVVNEVDVDSTDPAISANVPMNWEQDAMVLGNWIINDSEGQAKVVILRDDEFEGIKLRNKSMVETLEGCAGCEVLDDIDMTITELTDPSKVGQQVDSILAQHPDVEYIVSPFSVVDSLIVPALRRHPGNDVQVVGYDGDEAQMALCSKGDVSAVVPGLSEWFGWAAVDQMNRVFHGEEPVDQKVPSFILEQETCPTEGTGEDTIKVDFRKEYENLWTQGG